MDLGGPIFYSRSTIRNPFQLCFLFVLRFINLAVFRSTDRHLEKTNGEGWERACIEINFMTSFHRYYIPHKLCHFALIMPFRKSCHMLFRELIPPFTLNKQNLSLKKVYIFFCMHCSKLKELHFNILQQSRARTLNVN